MIRLIVNLSLLMFSLAWNTAIAEDSELALAESSPIVEYPFYCLEKDLMPCSLQAKPDLKYLYSEGGLEIHMGPKSVIHIDAAKEVSLVSGEFVVVSNVSKSIGTEFANLNVFPGIYLISIAGKKSIRVSNIDGFLTFNSEKKQHAIKLDQGFEIEVSRIRDNGWYEFSFPRPASYSNTIRKLAMVMSIERPAFYKLARNFQPVAKKAVSTMSEYYHSFTQRRIASHKAYLKRMKARRAYIEKMNAEYRALFRKENYIQ